MRYAVSKITDDSFGATWRLPLQNRKVAMLISQGKGNKEIANELGIVEGTVKAHVVRIMNRLDVNSRLEIAVRVLLDRYE